MELSGLIARGELLLADERPLADRLDEVEAYVEQFSQWYEANAPRLQAESSAEEKREVRRLMEQHERLMGQVQQLLQETGAAVKAFRKRAKAILAYAGGGPRRVSFSKTKKG